MSEPPEPFDESALAPMIDRYQRLAARLATLGPGDEREILREALRAQLEALWPILEKLVKSLAWGWVDRYVVDLSGSRGRRDAHESITTSMCLHILDTLAERPVTPTPPLGPLLRRIARNKMIDELRYNKRHSPDHPARPAPPSGEPPPAALPLSLEAAALHDHPVLSIDIAVQLDDRLYQEECMLAVEQYWQVRLSADERRIMQARLADPPTPYDIIAAQFEPPWSSESVRKRYSRIIADTKVHLRDLDLLPALEAAK